VLVLGLWISLRGIVAPIKALTATTAQLAGGELQIEVPGTWRGDDRGGRAGASWRAAAGWASTPSTAAGESCPASCKGR